MKKALMFFIFIVAAGFVIGGFSYFYIKSSEINKSELLNYLSENTVKNGYNYSIKCEEDINNEHLILYTFNKKGDSDDQIGIGVFKIISGGKYKLEKYITSNQSTGICPLSTENSSNNTLDYVVFYGNIIIGCPSKYKIVTSKKEFIEEFKIGEYFIKYYPVIDDQGTQILPA